MVFDYQIALQVICTSETIVWEVISMSDPVEPKNKSKNLKVGSVAVIGERELVLGFRLLGINSSFIADKEEGASKLMELVKEKKYSLIMASESLKEYLDSKTASLVDMSTDPLVVFVPLPGGKDIESVSDLAKRVLGIEIRG
jgi:V/A-type H+-transporting ATPase subunit F